MVQGGSPYGSLNLWLHLGPWDPSIYDDPRFEAFLEDVATGDGG